MVAAGGEVVWFVEVGLVVKGRLGDCGAVRWRFAPALMRWNLLARKEFGTGKKCGAVEFRLEWPCRIKIPGVERFRQVEEAACRVLRPSHR